MAAIMLTVTGALAACGGGAAGVAPAAATGPVNGPYGPGGPYAAPRQHGAGHHTGAQQIAQAAVSRPGTSEWAAFEVAARPVSGSVQLNQSHGIWWLPELGPGVSATAPATVRPGTGSAADAAAGFYDAFYAGRMAAACGYVIPGERGGCPTQLTGAAPAAGSLLDAAIGYVVAKGDAALVSMTGLVCDGQAAPDGCLGQHTGGYVFEQRETFDILWGRLAAAGGNPVTATPVRLIAGRWYVDLTAPSSPES